MRAEIEGDGGERFNRREAEADVGRGRAMKMNQRWSVKHRWIDILQQKWWMRGTMDSTSLMTTIGEGVSC